MSFLFLLVAGVLIGVLFVPKKQETLYRLYQKKIISFPQMLQIQRFELEQRVEKWLKKGLITKEQKDKIFVCLTGNTSQPKKEISEKTTPKAFDSKQDGQPKVSWLSKIALVGIACIIVGVIALIAANWELIPTIIKLSVYFIVFACLTSACVFTDVKHDKTSRELLVWANIGWGFAGIALIGQIFHLTGYFWDAALMGAVLSVPFVLLSEWKATRNVWAVVYLLSAVNGTADMLSPLFVLAAFPIACRERNNPLFVALWVLSFIFCFVRFPFSFGQINQVFPAALIWAIVAVLYAVFRTLRHWSKTSILTTMMSKSWLVVAACCIVIVDCAYSFQKGAFGSSVELSIWILFFTMVFPFAAIGLFEKNKKTAFFVWGGSLLLSAIYCFVSGAFAGFVYGMLWLLGLAVYFARKDDLKLFHVCLGLMALRIGIQYYHLISSLLSTGVGLVLFGMALLCVIFVIRLSTRFFFAKGGKK